MKQYYRIQPDGYPAISPIQLEGFIEYDTEVEPQELKDAFVVQEQQELTVNAKQDKQILLDSITVTTTSGKVFDGREKDVPLMSGAIQAAEVLGLTEHQWKLHDNTVQVVTLAELKEALALAMQEIGAIKTS